MFGVEVGVTTLMEAFCRNEVSKALAQLRLDGHVESIGSIWKAMESLNLEDADSISIRRLKRLRGELRSEVALNRKFGRWEEAALAQSLLDQLEAVRYPLIQRDQPAPR